MPTYRLDVGYDGSGFHGFARNPDVRTVEGELHAALARITGTSIGTVVAGRTDAGVHARGQVVSFWVDSPLNVVSVLRSLRSMLGPEIGVFGLEETNSDFHARFSAKSRTYVYTIDDSPVPDPLTRSVVWHVGKPLDIDAMNRSASAFLGSHDFASLCRAQEGQSTKRTVFRAGWERQNGLLVYEVQASAFCHQMVRAMVALCVEAGRGRMDPDDVPAFLEARDRSVVGGAAPAHGLVLHEVSY